MKAEPEGNLKLTVVDMTVVTTESKVSLLYLNFRIVSKISEEMPASSMCSRRDREGF